MDIPMLDFVIDSDTYEKDPSLRVDIHAELHTFRSRTSDAFVKDDLTKKACTFPDCYDPVTLDSRFCFLHDPRDLDITDSSKKNMAVTIKADEEDEPVHIIQLVAKEKKTAKRQKLIIPDRCEHRANKRRCKNVKSNHLSLFCAEHGKNPEEYVEDSSFEDGADFEDTIENEKAISVEQLHDSNFKCSNDVPSEENPESEESETDAASFGPVKTDFTSETNHHDDDKTCIICLQNVTDMVRYCNNPSCGFKACLDCNESTAKTTRKCPYCKKAIRKLVSITHKKSSDGTKIIETLVKRVYREIPIKTDEHPVNQEIVSPTKNN